LYVRLSPGRTASWRLSTPNARQGNQRQIPSWSSAVTDDLRPLWRRIAFSVALHNTDDHLRNHGFLRHKASWRRAPGFDINPNPELAAQRVTSIGGAVNPADEVSALLAYAESFGLSAARPGPCCMKSRMPPPTGRPPRAATDLRCEDRPIRSHAATHRGCRATRPCDLSY
jgi:hypothetical protein